MLIKTNGGFLISKKNKCRDGYLTRCLHNMVSANLREPKEEFYLHYGKKIIFQSNSFLSRLVLLEQLLQECFSLNMKIHYFSTNTSSKRVAQSLKNPKASVYCSDKLKDNYKGAFFTGTIEVCTDHENKTFPWHEGSEIYYPKGIE